MLRAACLLAFILATAGCLSPTSPPDASESIDSPGADVTFDAVRFETSAGPFVAILYTSEAPETVANIQRLVSSGYYDGREFNRVIPGFVIQEVDRLGGTTDDAGRVPLEAGTRAMFSAGALGIARDEDPNSGGPEFFVMDFAASHLYGGYTVFGQVVEGLDIVHAIARVDTIATGPASSVQPPGPVYVHDRIAVEPVVIRKATMEKHTLGGLVAGAFPLVVGNRTVVEEPVTIYTPEWPANLAPGRASTLTWYVFTYEEDPRPDLSTATVHIEGPNGTVAATADLVPTPDAADARILHTQWTPTMAGPHLVNLVVDGKVAAAVTIDIKT